MPIISIIVPCFLQAQYLSECLTSVVNQTFSDWECIIINDGSPDNTEEIATIFIEKDERFIYLKTGNNGVSAARNKGINIAKGKFILPLDADDTINDTYIEKAIEIFNNAHLTTLVYCNAIFFGIKKGHWNLPLYSYKRILRENIIFCSCVFYKESAIKAGLYDENMQVGFEDWEFLLRLLDENSSVIRLEDVLFNYRVKKQSRTVDIDKSEITKVEIYEKIYRERPEVYRKFYGDVISIIQENETKKEKIEIFKTFKPNRNFKNLIKFFKKQQMFNFD
jgi:glycosyltransferase involved in cell wall biosynthesis